MGLKVLLTQNKWPFQKGMVLSMWVKIYESSKGKFLHLKAEDGK